MEVGGAHVDVMGGGVVLRVVVCKVGGSGAPIDVELALENSVFEPVEVHIDGFGTFLVDGVCEDPVASFIVSAQRSGWLWVAEFL